MPSPYDADAFSARVNFAASYIASGRRTTRTFDTCFEMHDGDEVAVALYRRAMKNPGSRLAAGLFKYLNRESVEATAKRLEHVKTCDLPKTAAETRARIEAENKRQMDERDRQKKAEQEATAAAGYSVREIPKGGYSRWIYISPDGSESEEWMWQDTAWYSAKQDLEKRTPALA